jgi:guanylate kinase
MSNERHPRRGVLLIVASPSGAGKTSLCRRLMADHGGLELSVSMTTRPIRPGEVADRVFILPPSLEELRRRLVTRSQDADEVIERRIQNAKGEIEHCGAFDYVFVNDDFDRSYAELAHIYHAERSKRFRNIWVGNYKDALLNEAV